MYHTRRLLLIDFREVNLVFLPPLPSLDTKELKISVIIATEVVTALFNSYSNHSYNQTYRAHRIQNWQHQNVSLNIGYKDKRVKWSFTNPHHWCDTNPSIDVIFRQQKKSPFDFRLHKVIYHQHVSFQIEIISFST